MKVKINDEQLADLATNCELAAFTYERLASETTITDVMLFFLLKAQEARYMARLLRSNGLPMDGAKPARYENA